MQVKLAKSGWLGTTDEARKTFALAAAKLNLPHRLGVRNLGHDANGKAPSGVWRPWRLAGPGSWPFSELRGPASRPF